jgi:hypothetical protein
MGLANSLISSLEMNFNDYYYFLLFSKFLSLTKSIPQYKLFKGFTKALGDFKRQN